MKIAIMQPYFLPYIGYFQLLASVDKFVLYDDVNYINKGWINRNNILCNGNPTLINVPLSRASQNKLINEIEILNESKWQSKLLKTIELNYSKSPFYKDIFGIIETLVHKKFNKITQLNLETIKFICDYLELDTKIIESSTHYDNSELKGQYRILDICLKEGAIHYINPIGGIGLYDKEIFRLNNIKLNFIQSNEYIYKQRGKDFVSNLSILDILMNCEPHYINSTLLKAYKLI